MIRRLALVAAVALVAAQSASAHAILLETSPATGAVFVSAPAAASVTFDSAVRVGIRNAAVDANGHSILGGRPQVSLRRTLIIPLRPGLANGDYTVRWSVVSDDGHEEEGLIVFAVGAASPHPVAALTIRGFVTWQRIVMRTIFFLGVLGAVGAVFFALFVLRPLRLERDLLRREAHLLFAFLLLAFCGADALAHTTGAAGTRFDHAVTLAAVAAGVGCAAAALAPLYPRLLQVAWGAVVVLSVCPTLAGHAFDAGQPRVVAPLADLLHLGGAGVWLGGLVSLAAVLSRIPAAVRPHAVARFSSIAIPAVGLVALGGASRALTEVTSVSQLWSTGYGRALLAKSALLAAALGIAWLNRSALAAGLRHGGRVVALELLLLAAIVVAVATLTDLRPARSAARTATPSNVRPPPPAPASGAFVDARQAGRLAVAFAYLQGRATVTLIAPDGQGAPGVPVTIGGRAASRCGRGCFSGSTTGRSRVVAVTIAGTALRFAVPRALKPARVRASPGDPCLRGAPFCRGRRAAVFGPRLARGHRLPRECARSARLPGRHGQSTRCRRLRGDRDRTAALGPPAGWAMDPDDPVPRFGAEAVLGAEIAERVLRKPGRDHVLRPRGPGLVPAPVRPGDRTGARAPHGRIGALHGAPLLGIRPLSLDFTATVAVGVRLGVDRLEEARRLLECSEPGHPLAPRARRAAKTARGRDRTGGTHDSPERERPEWASPSERPAPAGFVHDSILCVLLASIGDLILDVIVQLDEPLVPGDDRPAAIQVGAGGQAANVAAWAATLGAEARFIGKRGDDAAGRLAAAQLEAYGVEVVGPAEGRNGVVVSIAEAGDRSMASDRGVAPELRPDELEPAWLRCHTLHVSGYSLLREPLASSALAAAELARAVGARISVDLSAWTLIDSRFRERVGELAPDLAFANDREREAFGELSTTWIVKHGALGVTVEGMDYPARPTEVADPTGAGDAFAAGYLVGGVDLGLQAAARCCAKLGAMP